MSRPKRPVPTPTWIKPDRLARRLDARTFVAKPLPGTPRARGPILVATNDAPVDLGLIGHPSPKLVTSNGHSLLPELDYRMS